MTNIERSDLELAASALDALYSELRADLGALEGQIDAGSHDHAELADMQTARTALHSGMASIQEVLGWLLWVEEEADCAQRPLPAPHGVPIH